MFHLFFALTSTLAADYHFTTHDHEISMNIHFQKPLRGEPLAFYQDGKRQCPGVRCIDNFHGAAATVNFNIAKARPKAPKPSGLREVVTILEQPADMPPAPPLDLTIPVKDGLAADLQVMGYDEDGVPKELRARMRAEAPARMWRRVRQELYLNGSPRPFAVIEWKHTMNGIELVNVVSGTF